MPMPEIDKESRKRPLCYDPKRKQFIHFPEIVSGEAEIVPVDDLSDDDLKVLVFRRWEVLPEDTTVQAISGPPMRRDDVIAAIEKDMPFGKMTVEAEKIYLRRLLQEIQENLE